MMIDERLSEYGEAFVFVDVNDALQKNLAIALQKNLAISCQLSKVGRMLPSFESWQDIAKFLGPSTEATSSSVAIAKF